MKVLWILLVLYCIKIANSKKYDGFWTTSEWTPCSSKFCGVKGFQKREVVCKNSRNLNIDSSNCVRKTMPNERRSCSKSCSEDCIMSDFGSWSSCSSDCGIGFQIRSRKIIKDTRNEGTKCKNAVEIRSCENKNTQPCQAKSLIKNKTSKVGPWSECIATVLKEDLNTLSDVSKKFTTMEYNKPVNYVESLKNLSSFNVDFLPSSLSSGKILIGERSRHINCVENDLSYRQVQTCSIPKRCQVTPWSAWSPCKSNGCHGSKSRVRFVAQLPVDLPMSPCPLLRQSQACQLNFYQKNYCSRFVWNFGEWGSCEFLKEQTRCGGGFQERHVFCVLVNNNVNLRDVPTLKLGEYKVQSEYLCNKRTKPSSHRSCEVQCAPKCFYGQWSGWSECAPKHGCDIRRLQKHKNPSKTSGFIKRFRRVQVIGGTLDDCEHKEEYVPCYNSFCHFWHSVNVSECRPENRKCGIGRADRTVECRDMWYRPNNNGCKKAKLVARLFQCEKPCGTNKCVTSEWTNWSPCPSFCSRKIKNQTRERTVLAYGSRGVEACTDKLTETRGCHLKKCAKYHWISKPWTPCSRMVKLESTSSETMGKQKRQVYCVKAPEKRVHKKYCNSDEKPINEKLCSLLLIQTECVLSSWGPWSICPSCQEQYMLNITYPNIKYSIARQKRSRYILDYEGDAKSDCKLSLHQERNCNNEDVKMSCPIYRWALGNWSTCLVSKNTTPLQGTYKGIQKRYIRCAFTTRNSEDLKYEKDMTLCFKNLGSPPATVETCVIKLNRNNEAFKNCKTQMKNYNMSAKLISKYSKKIDSDYIFSEWSSCFIKDSISKSNCGRGEQIRTVTCASDKACKLLGKTQKRLCTVACPIDCFLSDWSAWAKCESRKNKCGWGVRSRHKNVLTEPSTGGIKCPHGADKKVYLYEKCFFKECIQHFWHVSAWTSCKLKDGSKLTPSRKTGYQTRTVSCFATRNSDGIPNLADKQADQHLCDVTTRPTSLQTCDVIGLNECIFSDWSLWSSCYGRNGTVISGRTSSCSLAFRKRTRSVYRDGLSCEQDSAEIQQTEECVENQNCFTYSTAWTEWSSCTLHENSECGVGWKERVSECQRSDGVTVDVSYCSQRWVEVGVPQLQSCTVPCLVNCVMNDWTRWSECDSVCGRSRRRSRTRNILRNSINGGRDCQSFPTTQYLPCEIVPCYNFKLSNWSNCQIENNEVCGNGIQNRNWKCFSEENTEKADILCENQLNLRKFSGEEIDSLTQNADENSLLNEILVRSCFVPCNENCHMSSWSPWTSCYRDCATSEETSKVQVGYRSRQQTAVAIGKTFNNACPRINVETKQCKPSSCYGYVWKVKIFDGNKKKVWCQKTYDSSNSTFGCDPSTKPSELPTDKMTFLFDDDDKDNILVSGEELDKEGNSDKDNKEEIEIDVWTLPSPFTPDGKLKIWAYGALAASIVFLVVFIAIVYFAVSACRRSALKKRRSPPASYQPASRSNFTTATAARSHASSQGNYQAGVLHGESTLNRWKGRKSRDGTLSRKGLFGDAPGEIPPYYSARTSSIGRSLYPQFPPNHPAVYRDAQTSRSDFSLNDCTEYYN